MRVGTTATYANVLDIPQGKRGKFKIRHIHKAPGVEVMTTTWRTAFFGQPTAKPMTFDYPTRWHELSENGGVWMTDFPIEQRQMDALISRASGKVVVGGLGLGYAVVALAAKPRVTQITVVEKSKQVIDLVWPATVSKIERNGSLGRTGRFGNALTSYNAVTIVHADLFDYLKQVREAQPSNRETFNFGLFDIWAGDGAGVFHETVVPLRALACGAVKRLVCWNEDIMRGQLLLSLRTTVELAPMPEFRFEERFPGLCEPSGSVYADWAVPFWRWYRDHRHHVSKATLDFVLVAYVQAYGRPELNHGLDLIESVTTREPQTMAPQESHDLEAR